MPDATTADEASAPSAGATRMYLNRCLHAQESQRSGYSTALREICAGRKDSHWIWYIWPAHRQVRTTSRNEYSLPHTSAAVAWLSHDVLGPRMLEITKAACTHLQKGVQPKTLFGSSGDVDKFHECVTMFSIAATVAGNHELATVCQKGISLLQRPAHAPSQAVAELELSAAAPVPQAGAASSAVAANNHPG